MEKTLNSHDQERLVLEFLLFREWALKKGKDDIYTFQPIDIGNNNIPHLVDAVKYDTTARDMASALALASTASDDKLLIRHLTENGVKYNAAAIYRNYELKRLIDGLLKKSNPKDTEGTHNGHDYVDLGIRNDKGERILFATCNIGASCPEEYGDYFTWGETSIRKRQDTFTFPFYNNKTHKIDKYNLEDKLETLKENDDVATVMWGEDWRMPGREEFKLLLNQTEYKWVTNYKGTSVNGYLFTGKDEFSSFVLFLPAAGYCNGADRRNAGDCGDYWSRSVYPDEPDFALNLYFEVGDYSVVSLDYRYNGLSVRPVLVLPE